MFHQSSIETIQMFLLLFGFLFVVVILLLRRTLFSFSILIVLIGCWPYLFPDISEAQNGDTITIRKHSFREEFDIIDPNGKESGKIRPRIFGYSFDFYDEQGKHVAEANDVLFSRQRTFLLLDVLHENALIGKVISNDKTVQISQNQYNIFSGDNIHIAKVILHSFRRQFSVYDASGQVVLGTMKCDRWRLHWFIQIEKTEVVQRLTLDPKLLMAIIAYYSRDSNYNSEYDN